MNLFSFCCAFRSVATALVCMHVKCSEVTEEHVAATGAIHQVHTRGIVYLEVLMPILNSL